MTVDTFEKLMSQCLDFLKLSIANGLIGRIVIDEAHEIITQYDFRQVFGCLSEIRTKLPYVPIIALSGTLPLPAAKQLGDFLQIPQATIQQSTSLNLEKFRCKLQIRMGWTSSTYRKG